MRHSTLVGTSLAQLADDFLSRITRPAFGSVEGNNAHRVGVLPPKQVLDKSGALTARKSAGLCSCRNGQLINSIWMRPSRTGSMELAISISLRAAASGSAKGRAQRISDRRKRHVLFLFAVSEAAGHQFR